MRGFLGLTKRNLLIYFKDIHAVIFSLLTSIIVFALYLVFLKGTFVSSINNVSVGLEDIINQEDIDLMVSTILLVGIVGASMITIPYSCLTTLVKDRENKIDFDISATPIKRWQIIVSYFVAAVISAFIVTSAILTVGLVVLNGSGDMNMSVLTLAGTYGIIFLGSISATAIFMIMSLFFKSSSTSSAFFGMLSAASGFVIGAYIPLAEFSENVQTICNLFPATQVTVLLRNNLLNGILENIDRSIGGVDEGLFVDAIKECFNFSAYLFGNTLSVGDMYLYILAILALSIVGMIAVYNKTYKRV